ncbi:hypothetical protein ACVWZM_004773 [Bradyrhizobium sp. USDA 4501]
MPTRLTLYPQEGNNAFPSRALYGGPLEGYDAVGPLWIKSHIQGLCAMRHGMAFSNRLAFSEALPRNSESRVLAIALRMIKNTISTSNR